MARSCARCRHQVRQRACAWTSAWSHRRACAWSCAPKHAPPGGRRPCSAGDPHGEKTNLPNSPPQHPRLKAVGDLVALATGMARKQACQTVCGKALAPESNVAVIAIELGPDGAP